MRRTFSYVGALVAVGVCVAAVVTLPGRRPVNDDRAAAERMALRLLDREPGFRLRARSDFPDDRWSREDHFANMELRTARSLAHSAGIDVGQLLFAHDALLRTEGQVDSIAACRPRLSY